MWKRAPNDKKRIYSARDRGTGETGGGEGGKGEGGNSDVPEHGSTRVPRNFRRTAGHGTVASFHGTSFKITRNEIFILQSTIKNYFEKERARLRVYVCTICLFSLD